MLCAFLPTKATPGHTFFTPELIFPYAVTQVRRATEKFPHENRKFLHALAKHTEGLVLLKVNALSFSFLFLCLCRITSPRPSLLNYTHDGVISSPLQKPMDLKQLKQRAAAIPPIVGSLCYVVSLSSLYLGTEEEQKISYV